MLRFPAALGVIFYHFYDRDEAPPPIEHLTSGGFFALFFMLSGFMLAYVTRGPFDARDFLWRRFARLYPMYFFAWALFGSFTWLVSSNGAEFARTFAFYGMPSFLLVQTWIPKTAPVWNWPGWSISTEVFFCLMFPLVFPFVRKVKHLVSFAVALLIVNALVYLFRAWLAQPPQPVMLENTLFESTWNRYINYFPPVFLAQFILGLALGRLFVERGPINSWYALPAIVATLLVLMAPRRLAGVSREAVLCVTYCGLLYALASVQVAANAATHLAGLLGRASYCLFILQSPVWKLYWYARGLEERPRSLLEMLPFLALLIVLALLTHRFVEEPASSWLRARWKRRVAAGELVRA